MYIEGTAEDRETRDAVKRKEDSFDFDTISDLGNFML